MRTAGVDLAAQPAQTGLCVIDWDAGPRCIELTVGADDGAIVAAAVATDRCGIDAPFGYPAAFASFVAGHDALDPAARPGVDTSSYRLRATDLWVWERHGRRPLSVSTDLIGVTALRCARLQLMVAEATGAPLDRTGRGRLAEVYPAAALAAWGISPIGYKRRTPQSDTLLADMAAAVASRFRLALDARHRQLAGTVADAFDALVAAIVTREVVAGRTEWPPPELDGVARREGWIHVPIPEGETARSPTAGEVPESGPARS
jgi:hypothetical protein